jgi:RHS repeat-associated protein
MLSFNDKNITYDNNGNMTSVTNSCGTTNYTWDVRNRLIGIQGYTSTCTSLSASFKYDALGRRMEKTINGRTIQYLYDGLDIVQEIENGLPSVNYIRTLNIDEPLARIEADGTVRYYQTDALGSVIGLTTENGQQSTVYSYDPFGNTTISGEASDNPFQYTGRENDGTGLYYYRARYYSPELQRFISEDPILTSHNSYIYIPLLFGDPVALHKYLYAANNPINYSDPEGFGIGDCFKCFYYMIQCARKGTKCREDKCKEEEYVSSDTLFRVCP